MFQPPRRINASLKESPGCHGNICQKSLHIVSSTFSARLPPPTAVPGLLPVTAHHHLLLPLQANNIFVGEKVSRLALNRESLLHGDGMSTEGQTGGWLPVGGSGLQGNFSSFVSHFKLEKAASIVLLITTYTVFTGGLSLMDTCTKLYSSSGPRHRKTQNHMTPAVTN